ncbi:hypothetical protein D3C86_1846370 [compost metagenome]
MAQPEGEVAVRVQPQDGLAEPAFELAEELIDLGQLFAGVGEEVVDVELGMVLAHVDGQRRAVLAAGDPQNVPLSHWPSPCR